MKQLIINADDFGMSEQIDNAIVWCFKQKKINRTTIMVNMPDAKNATLLAKDNGFHDKVGLHLNFISGRPMLESTKNSILCRDGFFVGELLKKKYYFPLKKSIKSVIQAETEAQIKAYMALGYSIGHIDSHHHVHIKFGVYCAIKPILRSYGFKSIRIAPNIEDMSIIRRIYRTVFNRCILPFKVCNHFVNTTNYMGAMCDYRVSLLNKGSVEIMVHPIKEKSKVIDLTSSENNNMAEYISL